MNILALESSGLVASAAIVTEEKLIAEYTTNFKKTHSQTLLPMTDAILKMTGIDISEIDAVAVSGGPGSFTGLRIGSATAKGLAMVLDIPVISVPTVDALAWNLCGSADLVCPLMDARRDQVYTGIYEFRDGKMICLQQQEAVSILDVIGQLNGLGRKVVFLGDGVPRFRASLEQNLTVSFAFAPVHLAAQRAGTLGSLALQYYKEGRTQTAAEHHPEYLRKSQAERELEEKKHEK